MHTIAVTGHICLDLDPVPPDGIPVTPGRLSELRELDDLRFNTGRTAPRPDALTSYSIVIGQPGADRSFWHRTAAGSSVVMGGTRLTPARINRIAPAQAPLFEGAPA